MTEDGAFTEAFKDAILSNASSMMFFADMALLYPRSETVEWIKSLPRKRKKFFTKGSVCRYRAWVSGRRRWVYE